MLFGVCGISPGQAKLTGIKKVSKNQFNLRFMERKSPEERIDGDIWDY